MTYCLGILVDDGLLMIADTRTHGGVDNVCRYRKLHCLSDEADCQLYVASAGSLSVTQAVIARLADAGWQGQGCRGLYDAAQAVGAVLREENARLAEALGAERAHPSSLLVGGRVGDEPPRLFLVYPEGNSIECMADLPYLQTGETKFGRAILDRTLTRHTPLAAAVKLAFLSFDSAMRSNLAVSRPLDMVLVPAEPGASAVARRIEQDDAYFNDLSRRWSAALSALADDMPEPYFLGHPSAEWPAGGIVTELRPH